MHKLLFVHEERYLDRLIRDVQELLEREYQLSGGSTICDLLAVLVMSPEVVHAILTPTQRCDLSRLEDRHSLFSPESVSVDGLWILVTLSRPDLEQPGTRHEALDRVLGVLRTQGFGLDSGKVFLVSPLEEPHLSHSGGLIRPTPEPIRQNSVPQRR
jgi:hypothetical protein